MCFGISFRKMGGDPVTSGKPGSTPATPSTSTHKTNNKPQDDEDDEEPAPRPSGLRPPGRTAEWKNRPSSGISGSSSLGGRPSNNSDGAYGPHGTVTAPVYGGMYSSIADPIYGPVHGAGGGQAVSGGYGGGMVVGSYEGGGFMGGGGGGGTGGYGGAH